MEFASTGSLINFRESGKKQSSVVYLPSTKTREKNTKKIELTAQPAPQPQQKRIAADTV